MYRFIALSLLVSVNCEINSSIVDMKSSIVDMKSSRFTAFPEQVIKYRANLITKGQKSVNDLGSHGELLDGKVEAEEVVDYILSPNCPRAFGLFAAQGSCRKYYHCR